MFKWLTERLHQRCIHCDTTDHWKWVCAPCNEELIHSRNKSLQLQLDVAVLNAGNPVLETLTVIAGDEVIGIVVPDSLKVIDDLGLIVPAYYREILSERS